MQFTLKLLHYQLILKLIHLNFLNHYTYIDEALKKANTTRTLLPNTQYKKREKNANKFQFHRSWTCITMDEFNLKRRLSSCSVLTVSSEPVTICLIELYLRISLYECTGWDLAATSIPPRRNLITKEVFPYSESLLY